MTSKLSFLFPLDFLVFVFTMNLVNFHIFENKMFKIPKLRVSKSHSTSFQLKVFGNIRELGSLRSPLIVSGRWIGSVHLLRVFERVFFIKPINNVKVDGILTIQSYSLISAKSLYSLTQDFGLYCTLNCLLNLSTAVFIVIPGFL